MKKHVLIPAFALLLAISLSGIPAATAAPPNLDALWVGTISGTIDRGGIDHEFFSTHFEIDIFSQKGTRFFGKMLIGSDFTLDRLNVTGVISGDEILITSSAGFFQGELSGSGSTMKIRGVGSLQTDDFPSTTVLFTLRKD